MTQTNNQTGSGMSLSLETATHISTFANSALVTSLVVGVLATGLIVWMGSVKEHHWDISREQSQEKIARLESETATAKADLGNAQADIAIASTEIAKAHERTAELERETAEAKVALERERAERLRLEERIRPRNINESQKRILTELLANAYKGTVFIVPDWSDPEAKLFGRQIEIFLQDIGFPVQELNSPDKPLSYGKLGAFLVIRDKHDQPPHLLALYQAFRAAGFEFDLYEEKYVPDTESVLIGISTK